MVAGVLAHEFTHSLQGVILGNGWHWPVFFPITLWVCPVGPNGYPALACTTVGDGFAEYWWSGEAFAYGVQAAVTLAAWGLGKFMASRPRSGSSMPIRFDMVPAHRYVLMAWMFLEDAAKLAKQPPNGYPQLLLHLERYLGCCAIMLRAGYEAHYGRGRFDLAPDQNAMLFITAARHITSHGNASPIQSQTAGVTLKWDNTANAGHAVIKVTTSLDMVAAGETLKSKQDRDAAARFLAQHQGDLYRALHHALELVAGWVGQSLDDDFRALVNVQVGRMHLRAAFTDVKEFRRVVEAFVNNQNVELGDQSSLQLLGQEPG